MVVTGTLQELVVTNPIKGTVRTTAPMKKGTIIYERHDGNLVRMLYTPTKLYGGDSYYPYTGTVIRNDGTEEQYVSCPAIESANTTTFTYAQPATRAYVPKYDVVARFADMDDFEFTFENNILMETFDGISNTEVEVSMDSAVGQIGASVTGTKIGARSMTFTGRIIDNVHEMKQRMLDTFIPFIKGTIIVNEVYELECYVSSTPLISINRRNATFTIQFIAPYPYFKKNEEQEYIYNKPVASFYWHDDADDTQDVFFDISSYSFSNQIVKSSSITNIGNVECPFTATFTAVDTVHNPYILIGKTDRSDSKLLRIETTMNYGDRIVVSISEEAVVATLGDETVTGLIDFDSDLFTLPVGYNRIWTGADNVDDVAGLQVEIRYMPRYHGVAV